MRRWPLPLLLVVLSMPSVSAAGAERAYDRTCATHAEGDPIAAPSTIEGSVRFGRLWLIGVDRPQPFERPRGRDATMKIPVVVRTGPPVTVRIAALGATRARLDFDPRQWSGRSRRVAAGHGQRAVRFHPCPPDTPRFIDDKPLGPWTFYPGGFLVGRPGCARLTVSARGTPTVRRKIALGVPLARCGE